MVIDVHGIVVDDDDEEEDPGTDCGRCGLPIDHPFGEPGVSDDRCWECYYIDLEEEVVRIHGAETDVRAPVRVYCAGKIAKNDWRHELFPDLRAALDDETLTVPRPPQRLEERPLPRTTRR